MKAVFPSKGVVIVTKYGVNLLNDFYKNNLINSKLFALYQQNSYFMQSGNFSYFPKKSNIILYKANLLTFQKLQEVIADQMNQNNVTATNTTSIASEKAPDNASAQKQSFSDGPLDDNFIKNNPFFNTLISTEED